jgi:hypothetical protein
LFLDALAFALGVADCPECAVGAGLTKLLGSAGSSASDAEAITVGSLSAETVTGEPGLGTSALGDALRNPSAELKASAVETAGRIAGAATGIQGATEAAQAVGALIKIGAGSLPAGVRAVGLDVFDLAFDNPGLLQSYRDAISQGLSRLSQSFPDGR